MDVASFNITNNRFSPSNFFRHSASIHLMGRSVSVPVILAAVGAVVVIAVVAKFFLAPLFNRGNTENVNSRGDNLPNPHKEIPVISKLEENNEKEIDLVTKSDNSKADHLPKVEFKLESIEKEIDLVDLPGSLPISASFLTYQKSNQAGNLPIDLIIGRGKKYCAAYPKLLDERFDEITNKTRPYAPFTIDIDGDTEPHLRANCTSQAEMMQIPDNCVDDIFMEGIYPILPQLNVNTYCNVARILKEGGTFIMDVNCLCAHNQIPEVEKGLAALFFEFDIPLISMDSSINTCRNLNHRQRGGHTLTFCKYGDGPVTLQANKARMEEASRKMNWMLSGIRR